MLPRLYRLTSKKDFEEIFSKGKSIGGKFFNVVIIPCDLSKKSRFGVIVSNKVSKSAVVRNMVKRVVRAFIQERISTFRNGLNIVVVAKSRAAKECKLALLTDLENCFNKLPVV